jgi:hypothetical protein
MVKKKASHRLKAVIEFEFGYHAKMKSITFLKFDKKDYR